MIFCTHKHFLLMKDKTKTHYTALTQPTYSLLQNEKQRNVCMTTKWPYQTKEQTEKRELILHYLYLKRPLLLHHSSQKRAHSHPLVLMATGIQHNPLPPKKTHRPSHCPRTVVPLYNSRVNWRRLQAALWSLMLWTRFRSPIFSVCEDPSLLVVAVPPCPSNGTCWSCAKCSPSRRELRTVMKEGKIKVRSWDWDWETVICFLVGKDRRVNFDRETTKSTYDCSSRRNTRFLHGNNQNLAFFFLGWLVDQLQKPNYCLMFLLGSLHLRWLVDVSTFGGGMPTATWRSLLIYVLY